MVTHTTQAIAHLITFAHAAVFISGAAAAPGDVVGPTP
jgi:hypothetical protein